MVTIDYFSDLLCVWAYVGQVRLDELKREFAGQVQVRPRFMNLFADTASRIGEGWREQGGFPGFGAHALEVCAQWAHLHPSPDLWTRCRPASCTSAHVVLRAAGLCLDADQDPAGAERLDALVARVRTAFFEQARDIGRVDVLFDLLGPGDPSPAAVRARIDDGHAYAALHRDLELARAYGVLGSPTYVFNEGRQLLYGNVGYRIIQANLRELLSGRPVEGAPSWC